MICNFMYLIISGQFPPHYRISGLADSTGRLSMIWEIYKTEQINWFMQATELIYFRKKIRNYHQCRYSLSNKGYPSKSSAITEFECFNLAHASVVFQRNKFEHAALALDSK